MKKISNINSSITIKSRLFPIGSDALIFLFPLILFNAIILCSIYFIWLTYGLWVTIGCLGLVLVTCIILKIVLKKREITIDPIGVTIKINNKISSYSDNLNYFF